jgi:hypothetical protein
VAINLGDLVSIPIAVDNGQSEVWHEKRRYLIISGGNCCQDLLDNLPLYIEDELDVVSGDELDAVVIVQSREV